MAQYEIWLLRDTGERLDLLEHVSRVEYARVLNAPARFSIELPANRVEVFVDTADFRVEIWRGDPLAGARRLDLAGFVLDVDYDTDAAGMTTLVMSGPGIMQLLSRRIVAYRSGTSQAKKSGPADDIMKAIVRENIGSSSGTDYAGNPVTGRDLTALGLTVQSDLGLGPTASKAFAWRNMLVVLQEIAAQAIQDGPAIYFDLIHNGPDAFEFQTFKDFRGQDRSADSSSPVVLGLEYGNLGEPGLSLDWSNEITHVYAGGAGDSSISATSRVIAEAEDIGRKNASVWNRREVFHDVRMETTAAEVADSATGRLREGRPREILRGVVLDVPGNRYGVEWDLGDKVTVDYLGRRFDALVSAINVQLDARGQETVRGVLRLV